jgi:chromosome segregation ATPase
MKDEKATVAQPNLFGEADEVYNTLETELTMVNLEIDAAQKTIDRKEKEIEDLQVRQQRLSRAIVLVRKARKGVLFDQLKEPGKSQAKEPEKKHPRPPAK